DGELDRDGVRVGAGVLDVQRCVAVVEVVLDQREGDVVGYISAVGAAVHTTGASGRAVDHVHDRGDRLVGADDGRTDEAGRHIAAGVGQIVDRTTGRRRLRTAVGGSTLLVVCGEHDRSVGGFAQVLDLLAGEPAGARQGVLSRYHADAHQ